MSRTVAVVGVALGALMLGACSPGQTAPTTPTATPSPTCIDDGLRHAGPCMPAEYDAQQKEQAQFTEAKRVYEEFLAERNRLIAAGGADEPSAKMRELAEGPFLDEVAGYLRSQKTAHHRVEGSIVARNYRIERSRTRPGASFELSFCEDGTGTHAWAADGRDLGGGRVTATTAYFHATPSGLVISDWDGEVVPSCG